MLEHRRIYNQNITQELDENDEVKERVQKSLAMQFDNDSLEDERLEQGGSHPGHGKHKDRKHEISHNQDSLVCEVTPPPPPLSMQNKYNHFVQLSTQHALWA
jgi:hypothetical protein